MSDPGRRSRHRSRDALLDGLREGRIAVEAIGIACSTGGPQALKYLLGRCPGTLSVPVLVVQHMSSGFLDNMARWLALHTELDVAVAERGRVAERNVWLAPDGAHLLLKKRGRLTLDENSDGGSHRPSADRLFESMATAVGRRAMGIVLTGMGRDGAHGALAIREAGGTVVAQDEASSIVYGMPGATLKGGVDAVMSLEEIGDLLEELGRLGGAP